MKSKIKENIFKYFPVSALVMLTILLMLFFKYNKRDINRLLEKGKDNLLAFYSENLKPLFASTEISNEDVFNFALYESLPIDKEKNKVLLLSNQESGNLVYEIKPSAFNPNTRNYESFVDYLELGKDEKKIADSILSSYKQEIYLSVLTNEKNAVAINPKLNELQKAVLADLLTFADKVNEKKTSELFHSEKKFFADNKLSSYSVAAKEIPHSDFIFITPDTVFQNWIKVDLKEFDRMKHEELRKKTAENNLNNININTERKKIRIGQRKSEKPAISYFELHDSSLIKIVVPVTELALKSVQFQNDSIKFDLEKAAEKLREFTEKWEQRNQVMSNVQPSKKSLKIPKPGPPLKFIYNFFSDRIKNIEEYKMKADSLTKELEKNFRDSTMKVEKHFSSATNRKRIIEKNDSSIRK